MIQIVLAHVIFQMISDKSYLLTICWNASKNYLNLNKEDAIIAEDTLLTSDSLLTNSEQDEHTINDPAPIMNDELSHIRSTIATIPNNISPISNPKPPPPCDTHNSTLRYTEPSSYSMLSDLRVNNLNKIILAHLNIKAFETNSIC